MNKPWLSLKMKLDDGDSHDGSSEIGKIGRFHCSKNCYHGVYPYTIFTILKALARAMPHMAWQAQLLNSTEFWILNKNGAKIVRHPPFLLILNHNMFFIMSHTFWKCTCISKLCSILAICSQVRIHSAHFLAWQASSKPSWGLSFAWGLVTIQA